MRRGPDRSRLTIAAGIAVGAAWPFRLLAQGAGRSRRITGLLVAKAERTTVEGKNGIEITFDDPSAERLRQFTIGAVGQRMTIIVNRTKLASLRLIDPLVDGNILVTGQLDSRAVEELFSPRAVVDLEIE